MIQGEGLLRDDTSPFFETIMWAHVLMPSLAIQEIESGLFATWQLFCHSFRYERARGSSHYFRHLFEQYYILFKDEITIFFSD